MRSSVTSARASTTNATDASHPLPRTQVIEVALVSLAAAAVAAFFLGVYPVRGFTMPIGWDTPVYLGHASFVAERGLTGVPDTLPPPEKVLGSRAAFPLVALPLSGVFGVSTFKVAAAVPVAAATALALAAAALVSYARRWGAWQSAAVVVAVGVSPVLIRLMAPETYTDNLFAAAMFTAALLPVTSMVEGGEGFLPALLLTSAAGLANPPFFPTILAVLGVTALAYGPPSWRAWRGGRRPPWSTPAGRLLALSAGAASVAALGLFGLLRAAPEVWAIERRELAKKLRQDVSLYRLPLTLPLAALGAASLGLDGRSRVRDDATRRDGEAAAPARHPESPPFLPLVLGAWVAVAAVGVVSYLVGLNVPAHRLLASLVPFPILVAVGLLWLGRAVARRARAAAGVALVLAGLVALSYLGYRSFYIDLPDERGVEWLEEAKVQDAATASAYLDAAGVPRRAAVVFVVDDTGLNPRSYVPEMAYIIRSVLPPHRAEASYFYVGSPERFLAGRPTFREHPGSYNTISRSLWPAVRELVPRRPVALMLASFNPSYPRVAREHPRWVVAPGVVAVRGPRPASTVATPPIPSGPRDAAQAALLGAGTLSLLFLVGLGFALALLPRRARTFEVVAVSPAFGIAALILGGLLLDAFGLRLQGFVAALTALALALAGAAAAAAARTRRRGMATATG